MRFSAVAFAAGALLLGACGGGDKKAADTTATASTATTTDTANAAAATGGATGGATTAAAGAVAAKPATGQTHEVKMLGDDKGYRFEPANLTIKPGDAVKFIMVSGGPHDVAFDANGIPSGAAAQLNANIPNAASELHSQLLINPNDAVTISFAGVPAGTYNFHCTPHQAMNMKGVITVQ